MTTATEQLFAALNDFVYKCRTEVEITECLTRMDAAMAAGADWRAQLGPGSRDAAGAAAIIKDDRPVRSLLNAGVPLDYVDHFGYTMLHHAANFGKMEVVTLLIQKGLPFDIKTKDGKTTPLAMAKSWKHGKEAVPYLLELTMQKKEQEKQSKPTPGVKAKSKAPTGELPPAGFCAEAILASVHKTKPASAREALTEFATAFFAEGGEQTAEDFLLGIADQDNENLLPGALAMVAQLCAAQASAKTSGAVEVLAHIGDLTLTENCVPRILLVTGNLTVAGRLANYEGCIIAVGGNVSAEAIWSSGPFVAGGDVTTRNGFVGSYNDYKTVIGGKLTAPVLVKEDHVIKAKETVADSKYSRWDRVPKAIQNTLKIKKAPQIRFWGGVASRESFIGVLASVMADGQDVEISRFYTAKTTGWGMNGFTSSLAAVVYVDDQLGKRWCLLGKAGDVHTHSAAGLTQTQITDAGANQLGDLSALKLIGSSLYACGYRRQVYQQTEAGWGHIDQGILLDKDANGHSLNDLAGLDDGTLCAVGSKGEIALRQNDTWRMLESPTKAHLHAVCVDEAGRFCAAGANGTVLRGTAAGFEVLCSSPDKDCTLWDIRSYRGELVVSASDGLFTVRNGALVPFDTPPAPQHVGYKLAGVGDQLWSIGTHQIYCLASEEWSEWECPDNQ